jgi:ATP-dependent helicase Lhr and Lhr-like helicase
LKSQLEQVLGELVAWGLVTSDQFQGLRAMIQPLKRRTQRSRRSGVNTPLASGGRWSLVRPTMSHDDTGQRIEHLARTLLNRYGVVFRKLLERESGLPPWRDLLYVYRRLEARGEIRGGRFVQGFAGEHFALPEAINVLREVLRRQDEEQQITLSSTDPLNFTGIITPGRRIPAYPGHRVLYRNGKPIASSQGSVIHIDTGLPDELHPQIRHLLVSRNRVAGL